MRRSKAITLTLLSAAAVGLLAYAGSGPSDADTLFADEGACIRAHGADGDAACRDSFRAATAEHQATAPHFADPADCQAQTGGACVMVETKPGLAAYAVPVMAGVLIGRALSGGERPVLPVYGGAPGCAPGVPAGPECRTSSGGTGNRSSWFYAGSAIGTSDATGDARRVTTTARGAETLSRIGSAGTVSRGGLGSAGRGFAAAGG